MLHLDVHTHNLWAPAGKAIINLPEEALLSPGDFSLREGCLYSVGIHPWWTAQKMDAYYYGLQLWSMHPQVVAIGECGLDKLRGGSLDFQEEVFLRHLRLANELNKPVIIHCVRAFDRLLRLHREVSPLRERIVHGFRGKPALAQQLLAAGFYLSFGLYYHEDSFRLTPPERRYCETDEDFDQTADEF